MQENCPLHHNATFLLLFIFLTTISFPVLKRFSICYLSSLRRHFIVFATFFFFYFGIPFLELIGQNPAKHPQCSVVWIQALKKWGLFSSILVLVIPNLLPFWQLPVAEQWGQFTGIPRLLFCVLSDKKCHELEHELVFPIYIIFPLLTLNWHIFTH